MRVRITRLRLHLCVAPRGGLKMHSFVSRAINLVSRGLPLGGRMTGVLSAQASWRSGSGHNGCPGQVGAASV